MARAGNLVMIAGPLVMLFVHLADALSLVTIMGPMLLKATKGISDLVTVPGLVNLDFADVKAIMKDAGPAWMSIGHGPAYHDASRRDVLHKGDDWKKSIYPYL